MSGGRIGRLHGRVTIKDHSNTNDMLTQHGSKTFARDQPADGCATISRRRFIGWRRRRHSGRLRPRCTRAARRRRIDPYTSAFQRHLRIETQFWAYFDRPVPGSDMTIHSGPLTRTVADATLMTEVMAALHSLDINGKRRWVRLVAIKPFGEHFRHVYQGCASVR